MRHERHVNYGFGAHSCLGMHLARMELSTAIEEWVNRPPGDFSIKPGTRVLGHPGVVGLTSLPLVWNK